MPTEDDASFYKRASKRDGVTKSSIEKIWSVVRGSCWRARRIVKIAKLRRFMLMVHEIVCFAEHGCRH